MKFFTFLEKASEAAKMGSNPRPTPPKKKTLPKTENLQYLIENNF